MEDREPHPHHNAFASPEHTTHLFLDLRPKLLLPSKIIDSHFMSYFFRTLHQSC
ncbi:hypothetical protein ACJX0J_008895 [Zea mays]